jgi:hypothetical protein
VVSLTVTRVRFRVYWLGDSVLMVSSVLFQVKWTGFFMAGKKRECCMHSTSQFNVVLSS